MSGLLQVNRERVSIVAEFARIPPPSGILANSATRPRSGDGKQTALNHIVDERTQPIAACPAVSHNLIHHSPVGVPQSPPGAVNQQLLRHAAGELVLVLQQQL